jgi:hypothetical protein
MFTVGSYAFNTITLAADVKKFIQYTKDWVAFQVGNLHEH